MKRAYLLALAGLLGVLYVAMVIAALEYSPGTMLLVSVALYVADDQLIRRHGDPTMQWRLREVAADPVWRAFLRQALLVVFLVDWGVHRDRLSRTEIVVIVVAVLARQGLVSLYAGLTLVITRRRRRRIETRNLAVPGAVLPPPLPGWLTRGGARWQLHTEILLLAGLAIGVATDSPGWIALGAASMAVGAAGFVAALVPQVIALLHVDSDATRLAAAQQAIWDLQPDAILYFSGGVKAAYQVTMWFETMERLERPVLVLLRERRYLHLLPEATLPVLVLPYTSDLVRFDFTGSGAALFVANVGRNLDLLRVPTVKSAFIGHGDSDKTASFNPFTKVYDEVWVAGEAGRERYARARIGVRPDEIVVVGRPQLDGIHQPAPRPAGAPFAVLYAPTWEGWTGDPHASSLLSMGREVVNTLVNTPGVRLIFKPHPLTGTVNSAAGRVRDEICAALAGTEHVAVLEGGPTLYDCFDESDAMVSDISSVVSDYLRSEKPYFVTNGAEVPDGDFRAQHASAGAAYLIGPRAAGLSEGLALARGADPQRAHRLEVCAYLLGDPEVESMTRFRQAVDDLAARAREQIGDIPLTDRVQA